MKLLSTLHMSWCLGSLQDHYWSLTTSFNSVCLLQPSRQTWCTYKESGGRPNAVKRKSNWSSVCWCSASEWCQWLWAICLGLCYNSVFWWQPRNNQLHTKCNEGASSLLHRKRATAQISSKSKTTTKTSFDWPVPHFLCLPPRIWRRGDGRVFYMSELVPRGMRSCPFEPSTERRPTLELCDLWSITNKLISSSLTLICHAYSHMFYKPIMHLAIVYYN